MKITLFHNRECGSYLRAIQALEEALIDSNVMPLFVIQLVRSDEEAKKFKFSGSPSIHIDGKDIDPETKNVTAYGANVCKTYAWNGETFDYPPKEMIMEMLKKHS